jgi:hypothetical protein
LSEGRGVSVYAVEDGRVVAIDGEAIVPICLPLWCSGSPKVVVTRCPLCERIYGGLAATCRDCDNGDD